MNNNPCWWVLTLHSKSLDVQEEIQVLSYDADAAIKIAGQLLSDDWSVKCVEPVDSVVHP